MVCHDRLVTFGTALLLGTSPVWAQNTGTQSPVLQAAGSQEGTGGNVGESTQEVGPATSGELVQQAQAGATIPTPWFANEAVRQELGLTEPQFQTLIEKYNELYTQQQLLGITGTDRAQQPYQQAYLRQLANLLPSTECRLRFDQLHRQYLAYSAFGDAEVQDLLNLSLRQRRRLEGLAIHWNRRIEEIKLAYLSNPHLASIDFVRLQADGARITQQILTPQQMAVWRQLTGGPFQFPLECYFKPTQPVVR